MSSIREVKENTTTRKRITVPQGQQTTNAIQATAFSISVAENSALSIVVEALIMKSDSSAAQILITEGCFRRMAGGNVIRASGNNGTVKPILRSLSDFPNVLGKQPEIDLVANTSTQAVDVKITGQSGITINWNFDITTLRNVT